MLLDRHQSALLVVDVQSRLAPHVFEHERVIDNCVWLLKVAKKLDVPRLVSEHCPESIGATVAPIGAEIDDEAIMKKAHFSCMREPNCAARVAATGAKQIVVAGMEAHVCVLQTVLSLLQAHYQTYLVADSVSSRVSRDAELAVQRARDAGAHIVSREMVLFEWAERGATPVFKELHREFLKNIN